MWMYAARGQMAMIAQHYRQRAVQTARSSALRALRTGYVIENKQGDQLDVKFGDYADQAAVIATGTPSSVAFSDIQDNKVFVLEHVHKRIHDWYELH